MRDLTRRCFLRASAGLVGCGLSGRSSALAQGLPSARVAIERCRRYDFDLVRSALLRAFDGIGGVGALVRNRTVTVKVNLTGNWNAPVYTLSPLETVYTHPIVALAAVSLFADMGARRIVICESCYQTVDARSCFRNCGYDVDRFESTVPGTLWEDTRNRGQGSSYREVRVPAGGTVYDRFFLNHRYVDTDVVVSIAKMKNHDIAGITLAMKNMFGITPSSLYSGSTQDEGSTSARIDVLHEGVPSAAGGEVFPVLSHDRGIRVPHIIVDILKARPVDLSIIDGIVSMHGGEGAWHGTRLGVTVPGLLIAGRNCVCTDSVAAAVMGYDPGAPPLSKPFFPGENMLRLGADRGIGTNDPADIEVVGLSIEQARYGFLPAFKPARTGD